MTKQDQHKKRQTYPHRSLKKESRVIWITTCPEKCLIALIFRQNRIEKLFIAYSLEELINTLINDPVYDEINFCTSKSDEYCKKLAVEYIELPSFMKYIGGSKSYNLINNFVRSLCENIKALSIMLAAER